MNGKIKVSLITHSISHFEVPLYRAMAASPELDLKVFYWDKVGLEKKVDDLYERSIEWEIPLLDGYQNEFIPTPLKLFQSLWKERPAAAIIYGYSGRKKILAILSCFILGIPLVFRGTATLLESRSPLKEFFKKIILGLLFKFFKAVLVGGTLNKKYYLNYGVKPENAFFVPFTVDVKRFLQLAEQPINKTDLAKKFGLTSAITALFVGNLITKKGPHILLPAFKEVARKNPEISLLVAGDGALLPELKRYAMENGLENRVIFLGFLNQKQVPEAYAVSDFAIFPSLFDETWARAVNEAMAYGLPIIASRKVGATGDIIKDGINGFVIPENDFSALAEKILQLAENPELRKKMGQKSKSIISEWTYEKHIPDVVTALKLASKNIR